MLDEESGMLDDETTIILEINETNSSALDYAMSDCEKVSCEKITGNF